MTPLNKAFLADAIGSIFMAGLFLFLYFNRKQPRLYKKKWVLAGCVLWLGLGGYQIYDTQQKIESSRIPTVEETKTDFHNAATLADQDLKFLSKDGYEIIIPKGFYYNPNRNGTLTLVASKQAPDNTQFGISVMKMESSESTESSAKGIVESFKRKAQSVEHEIINNNLFSQVNFKLKQKDGFTQGIVIFKKSDNYTYMVFITAKKQTDNLDYMKELEKTVKSFKIL